MAMIRTALSLPLVAAALTACAGSGPHLPPDPVGHFQPQVCAVGSVPAAVGFVGLDEAAARELAIPKRLTVRVLGSDGSCAIPMSDADGNRLNLYFEQGRVSIASIG